MSEKVHKALRRQQSAQTASDMSPCQSESERKARYMTIRIMPLIPFMAMVFASPQGSLFLPEGFRDPLYVSISGCLFYILLWVIDLFLLKRDGWHIGIWKWLGLAAPVGCLYLWFRARYTDKEYVFSFVYVFMKILSLFIVGSVVFI